MILTGYATIQGIPSGAKATWSGYASVPTAAFQVQESLEDAYTNTVNELADSLGKLYGLRIHGDRRTISINFTPRGGTTTNTSAAALAAMKLPITSIAKVTLASFQDPAAADDYNGINGDWLWTGGATRSFSTGLATVRMTIWRPLDHAWGSLADAITALTTTVS